MHFIFTLFYLFHSTNVLNFNILFVNYLLSQTCSNFKAGSKIRSKSKAAKLDITATFGAACRHEFPLLFINMTHGERYWPVSFLLYDPTRESQVMPRKGFLKFDEEEIKAGVLPPEI